MNDRKWDDIGYHYIIDRDGKVAKGRQDSVVGAHVKGHNRNSMGICLLGGFGSDSHDKFKDHFTDEQENALLQLITQLEAEHPIKSVRGHNSFSGVSKACPGFQVKKWLAGKETGRSLAQTQPSLKESTSIKGNLTNIVSGGGLAAFATQYDGLDDITKYTVLGVGVFVLLVGLWLFRKKLLKIADKYEL